MVFLDHRDVVHHEYALKGRTGSKEYYLEVLHCLHDAVRRKRPEKRPLVTGSCTTITPLHILLISFSFLAKYGIEQVQHLPIHLIYLHRTFSLS